MNKTYQQSPRSNGAGLASGSTLAIIVAMAVSTAAHAEYRCSTPESLTAWEQRACELARHGAPDALIHFVHRMNTINAGLYIDDYVGRADAERWELAKEMTRAEALGFSVRAYPLLREQQPYVGPDLPVGRNLA
jgi:hypothetical protein